MLIFSVSFQFYRVQPRRVQCIKLVRDGAERTFVLCWADPSGLITKYGMFLLPNVVTVLIPQASRKPDEAMQSSCISTARDQRKSSDRIKTNEIGSQAK